MIFLFDENTSKHLVDFMYQMGAINIRHLQEFYPQGTKDPEFLPYVAEEGMILVSADKAMRKAHKELLKQHNVKVLFLPSAYVEKWTIWEQAIFMFRYWREIEEAVQRLKSLTTKDVSLTGKLNDT